jgi:pimeloyl-ACP methyl ester carboxylesterase
MPYFEGQGARLYYERQGDGNPPLVLVHGFTCDHTDWQRQVDFFKPRQAVVTCDLRGHGASSGDPVNCDIETYGADVSALLDALDLAPAILIGHSLGCRVVLQAYLDAPQRVAGLVLVDGSRMGGGDPPAAEQAVLQRFQTMGYATVLQRMFADMFVQHSDPAVKQRIIERALALPEATGAALFSRLAGWDAQYLDMALSQVAVPILVMQSTYVNLDGARVALQPGENTPYLNLIRRRVPTAQIEVISGAGHFSMLDAPEAVDRRLEEFMTAVPRSGS